MKIDKIYKLKINEEIIEKTIENTIKKYNFTIKNLSYSRTPVELLDNIFMGDFAKNLICHNLRIFNIDVIDYDEIRNDDFQSYDKGWDLKVKNFLIEVKSSIPPKNDISFSKEITFKNLINNRDIKIYAKKCENCNIVYPENLNSDVFIQVYFLGAKTYKKGFNSFEKLFEEINNNKNKVKTILNINKYFDAYFFGFLTKQDIINIYQDNLRKKNDTMWSFSWTEAKYWKAPLKRAKSMEELLMMFK